MDRLGNGLFMAALGSPQPEGEDRAVRGPSTAGKKQGNLGLQVYDPQETHWSLSESDPPMLRIPYPRPEKLSDPSADFSTDELRGILECPDSEMGFYELSCIFQEFCPAGHYEECAYFIPIALVFAQNSEDNGGDLVETLLRWMDRRIELLKNDLIFDSILDSLSSIALQAMSEFGMSTLNDGRRTIRHGGLVRDIINTTNRTESFLHYGDSILDRFDERRSPSYPFWRIYLISLLPLGMSSDVVKRWRVDWDANIACTNAVYEYVFQEGDDKTLEFWDKVLMFAGL